jgi:hypothetical protein
MIIFTPNTVIRSTEVNSNFAEILATLDNRKQHYGAIYYSSGGITGGQVIGAVEGIQAFDVADANNYGVTTSLGASAYIKINRAGVYNICVYEAISDVSTTGFIAWIGISLDNGVSWYRTRFIDATMNALTNQITYNMTTHLPINARITIWMYNSAGATRVASPANTADSRYYMGPKLTVTEINQRTFG